MDNIDIYYLGELNKLARVVLNDSTINLTEKTIASDINGWDSITHIELIMAIERHFNIKFKISELMNFQNVGDLLKSIINSKK